jgi:hypothetical protein
MDKIEFKLDYQGVHELLTDKGLCDDLQEIGEEVASRAGSGYTADSQIGRKRVHTFVRASTTGAYYDNLTNNTLLKALQS